MVEAKTYHLPATKLIPNSRYPLVHYPGLLSNPDACVPTKIWDTYSQNGWRPQWIFRYGPTQTSHYHSRAHECMTVLTGTATIRFGAADIDPSLSGKSSQSEDASKNTSAEAGGVEIEAKAGDVFLVPAGVAHKTFNAVPESTVALLTPGDPYSSNTEAKREALPGIKLSGFTMLGAYPENSSEWDFATGGEDAGQYEKVRSLAKPGRDPVLGLSEEGLCGLWSDL